MKLDRLAAVPMFRACTRRELSAIAKAADTVAAESGTTLVREGEAGREFFVILDGIASVTRGRRHVAALGPGDYFGELALLDGERRDATVKAASPMEVLVVSQRCFAGLLNDVPTLARHLLAGMARRLHELDRSAV